MDDFPSNSQQRRDSNVSTESARNRGERSESAEKPKVERITTGDVVRRKRSLGRRFREIFVGGDARSVMGYVFMDVLIPAAKDAVADATSQGIERMLFGDVRSTSRRPRSSGSYLGHVNYARISSGSSPYGTRPDPRQDPRDTGRRARTAHNFEDIVLETRGEAEEVIDRLFDLISRYESASVADLYDLTGITGNYTDNKWGWTDFRGAGVQRVRNGYLLDLPRPIPLD